MAKHPVPKQKKSRARSSRRYKSFQNRARKRLTDAIVLVKCESCGATKRAHHACPECKVYRGRSIKAELAPVKKEKAKAEEVTTIKAD